MDRKLDEAERIEFEHELFIYWRNSCVKADLPAPSAEHGIHIIWFDDAADMAVDYVAKWSTLNELTGTQSKEGRRMGRNPWQLLEAAEAGDEQAGKLWLEFADAFHGRTQLRWSKGLRERLKVKDFFIGDQIVETGESEMPKLVMRLTKEQWRVICRAQAQDFLLELVEQEGTEAARGAVNKILSTVPLPGGRMVPLLE